MKSSKTLVDTQIKHQNDSKLKIIYLSYCKLKIKMYLRQTNVSVELTLNNSYGENVLSQLFCRTSHSHFVH